MDLAYGRRFQKNTCTKANRLLCLTRAVYGRPCMVGFRNGPSEIRRPVSRGQEPLARRDERALSTLPASEQQMLQWS